jgi:hypothetical protein
MGYCGCEAILSPYPLLRSYSGTHPEHSYTRICQSCIQSFMCLVLVNLFLIEPPPNQGYECLSLTAGCELGRSRWSRLYLCLAIHAKGCWLKVSTRICQQIKWFSTRGRDYQQALIFSSVHTRTEYAYRLGMRMNSIKQCIQRSMYSPRFFTQYGTVKQSILSMLENAIN